MKNSVLGILFVLLAFGACKKDSSTKKNEEVTKEEAKNQSKTIDFDYKFPSVEKLIDCEGVDTALLQEAVQSFEE